MTPRFSAVRAALASFLAVALLAAAAPTATASQAELDRAQARANRAARELDEAQTRQAELEEQIGALEGQVAQTLQELAGLQGVVKERAVQQYIRGTDGGDLVLGNDLAASTRKSTLARFVSLGDDDAIDEYKRVTEDLGIVRGKLDEAKAQQSALLDQMQERVNVTFAELRKLQKLEKERKARDAARAAAARRGRASASTRGPSFIAGNGSWMCPVQGPVAFSNDWGNARSGGRRHQGTDLLSPRGTPVVAVVGGTVRYRNGGLGGISVYVNGDDGNEYYGAHMDSTTGASGHVAQGTVLGYVGNTGNARGGPTHLHFEIHPGGGRAVNPYPTLRQYC
jgi:murein DD-endopeptidase MepM/ murein hydrolase activator NlpD